MAITPVATLEPPTVAEFFAGIGLARMGLEAAGARVRWANDFSAGKHQMYRGHFGDDGGHYVVGDVSEVTGADVPSVDIAWSSFPCTDLSLAGLRAGLAGGASSTFFQFTRVVGEMGDRKPRVVALENVSALASSRGGDDIAAAVRELNRLGYSVDVVSIDARRFVPQSRPRVFLIGLVEPPSDNESFPTALRPQWLERIYSDASLRTHRARLPDLPSMLENGFTELADDLGGSDARWWDAQRVQKLCESLSPLQRERLDRLIGRDEVAYRTAYRRTRHGVPVWEIRSDDVAGCLRTARGGSSKQAVVKAGHGKLAVRWMTSREYAKLMGADGYEIGGLRDSQILFGFGDAVCVDVVEWLATHYLLPASEAAQVESVAMVGSVDG